MNLLPRSLRGYRRPWLAVDIVAGVTVAAVAIGVGVEQGIVLAIVLSIIEIIRRAYGPADFVVGVDDAGRRTFTAAEPGAQSAPGLVVFRYDEELFYANASRFTDDVEAVVQAGSPSPG
jgi:MFS superfamily sulfate permease-like transporter